jgi:RNA polymerase sigma-70 factor (ECF subfamily)
MTDTFTNFQPRLFSIAYRMLGVATEAEDMVQEVFIRWHDAEQGAILNPEGWLTTVMTRLCIDRLRVLQKQRETYVGPWLPAPLGDESLEGKLMMADSVSFALLVVLERLSPVERAVFLLREVFGYGYEQIGEMVERSAVNCRQLFSRAKKQLDQHTTRFPSQPETHDRLFAQFVTSCQSGDMNALLGVLAEDITVWSDGGGKVAAAMRPIHGADKAARFLLGLTKIATPSITVALKKVNGQSATVAYENGVPIATFLPQYEGGKISAIYITRNPDKLRHIG